MFYLWSCVACWLSSVWIHGSSNGFQPWVETFGSARLFKSPPCHIFQQKHAWTQCFHLQPQHMTSPICNVCPYIFYRVPLDERYSLTSTRQKGLFCSSSVLNYCWLPDYSLPLQMNVVPLLVSPPLPVKFYTGLTSRTGAQSQPRHRSQVPALPLPQGWSSAALVPPASPGDLPKLQSTQRWGITQPFFAAQPDTSELLLYRTDGVDGLGFGDANNRDHL